MIQEHQTDEVIRQNRQQIKRFAESFIESGFQLCPKCNGTGQVFETSGGLSNFSSVHKSCPVCLGRMIINKATGLPPIGTPV